VKKYFKIQIEKKRILNNFKKGPNFADTLWETIDPIQCLKPKNFNRLEELKKKCEQKPIYSIENTRKQKKV